MDDVASRRTFLKTSALIATGVALSSSIGHASTQSHNFHILIDQNMCIGCNSCAIACRAAITIPVWRAKVLIKEEGKRITFTPNLCRHCSKPVCLASCPEKALYQDNNGIVHVQENKCIGCKTCVQACPYQAMSVGIDNIAHKCEFCPNTPPVCVESCSSHALRFVDLSTKPNLSPAVLAQIKLEQNVRVHTIPLHLGINDGK